MIYLKLSVASVDLGLREKPEFEGSMSVLKVTAAVFIIIFCAWITLRFYGLSQVYQSYHHPLIEEKETPWIFAWGGDLESGPSHTMEAFHGAARQEDVILAFNLQMNAEKHFYVIPPDFKVGSDKINFLNFSDAEAQRLDLGDGRSPLRFEQVLENFGHLPLFIWVRDNVENIDLRLEPILKKHQASLLVHSEYDNVVKSIKKLIPNLLYGTGVGQRIRFLMLSSIGLEPVAAIDGDLLITPLREKSVRTASIEMKNEILRRQKIFILGPLNDIDANHQAVSFGATGYLTSYPQDLKKRLKSSAQTL